MIPRYYQNDAVYAIWDYFKKGNTGNPIVAMPTGTGKSLVIASFIRSAIHYYPSQRIIKLTHVKELIAQNFDKLIKIWPTAPAGIYSAGLGRKDTDCQITFAGIGSIANRADCFGHIDLVIIDECHRISPKQTTQYAKFIVALKETNPHLKVIGLTATPYRLGQGLLTEQPSLFTDICYNNTSLEGFNKLIDEGYLATLIPKATDTLIDVSAVKLQGGEFVNKQLQEATDKEEITYAALKETLEVASDRNHWLIFATGIDHAINIKEAVNSFGIDCAIVHGDMTNSFRDEQLRLFKNGYYRAMVNVGVLTTGFDYPEIDLIVMLRPTNSPGLWVQMLGRGTRPCEGKENCMVLDFAGNTKRLGPINDPVLPKKKGSKKGGTAPVRICESCNTYVHASLKECPHCGFLFPIQVKFKATAATTDLIAKTVEKKEPEINEFKVDRVTYKRHTKQGGRDSLKVTYYCGLRVFHTWVCLWHEGFAKRKALGWWRKVTQNEIEVPDDIFDALDKVQQLIIPKTIKVQTDLKYPDIIEYNYH